MPFYGFRIFAHHSMHKAMRRKLLFTQYYNYVCLALCVVAPFIALQSASSAELVIQDVSGIPRSLTEVGEAGQIEFQVAAANGAAAEGAEITLTNTLTGEVLKAASSQGIVTFQGVAPGVWTVASSTAGITFTNVTVIPAALAASGIAASGSGLAIAGGSGITAGTAATGAVALAGVGGATALASNELGDDSNDNELSPFD